MSFCDFGVVFGVSGGCWIGELGLGLSGELGLLKLGLFLGELICKNGNLVCEFGV